MAKGSSQSLAPSSLARCVDELRSEMGDSVKLEDLGSVIERMLHPTVQHATALEKYVGDEIGGLLDYINSVKTELSVIQPHKIRDSDLPRARDELDAVLEATEDATGKILDAAETLEGLAEGTDAETSAALTATATKIYEASNFQDLTGQRIGKVVDLLHHIEAKIGEMAAVLGDGVEADDSEVSGVRTDRDGIKLYGPQRTDANKQQDIDALMGDMDLDAAASDADGHEDFRRARTKAGQE